MKYLSIDYDCAPEIADVHFEILCKSCSISRDLFSRKINHRNTAYVSETRYTYTLANKIKDIKHHIDDCQYSGSIYLVMKV